MKPTILTPLLLAAGFVLAQDGSDGDEFPGMGPVAFLWPPDREWGAAVDNTPPCGSAAGVTNRTEFPLSGGVVALVAQDESWLIQIAISHSNNPTSNNDFDIVTQSRRIPEMDEGHMCYPITNPGPDGAGSNATIQIRYTSEFDTDTNNTFYACADITYVANSQFTVQVPCFNATINEDDNSTTTSPTSSASSGTASPTSSVTLAHSSGSGSSGLSGGAIAGIVVGVLCGVGIVLGALFFLWRRGQKYKRSATAGNNPRKVDWDDPAAASPNLGKQVELNEMSGRQ